MSTMADFERDLDEGDEDERDRQRGIGEGMDRDGFAGPSERIVKPLTPEALAAFKADQDKAGVIYISRIPPGMRPTKVRHLMSAYGEVGRVYLQQEGALPAMLVTQPYTLIFNVQMRRERIYGESIPRRRRRIIRRAGLSSRTSVWPAL